MTDIDIQTLKLALSEHPSQVYWHPDSHTCRRVTSIQPPPTPLRADDEPEPSEVAYLAGLPAGDYVALYGCEPTDFSLVTPICS